jgi:hypothetical protein
MVDNAIQRMICAQAAGAAESLEILISSRLTENRTDLNLENACKVLEESNLRLGVGVTEKTRESDFCLLKAGRTTPPEFGMSLTLVLVAFTVGAKEGGSKDRHFLPF